MSDEVMSKPLTVTFSGGQTKTWRPLLLQTRSGTNNYFQEPVTFTTRTRKKTEKRASLSKWQSGMEFQGRAEDEVWQVKKKKKEKI